MSTRRAARTGRSAPRASLVVLAAVAVATTGSARGAGRARGGDRQGHHRVQRVAGLVPARGRREGRHLREERPRRRPQVLRRLHRVARRDGRRASSTPTRRRSTTRWPAVAGGSKQAIVVVNDNSAGNDAIICDESITSIEDLKGKTIAAEEGVVDHFLLLQGLATDGLTQDDIDFRGVLTADAAAELRRRAVRLRRRVRAVHARRRSSGRARTCVFSSKDFPGTIPDHIVVSQKMVAKQPEGRPEARRRLVRDARLHRGEPRRRR